jgi:hypothetical protein
LNYIRENSSTHIQYSTIRSIVFGGGNDIVNLEDHLDDLSGKFELIPLRGSRLEDTLLVHVGGALAQGINTDEWVLFGNLLLLDL